MNKIKIIINELFCEECNENVNHEIKIQLGLNSKGRYTNNYCLNCEARLREGDIKEIRTDFDCPKCKSFLNSGFVNVCGGCGAFLSWVNLDSRIFKLPKEEFKKKLLDILISLSKGEEPKNKHEVEIKQFKCPYCEHKETIKVKEQIWNDNTKDWDMVGVDYWECPECGEENDIGLESLENEFKVFKKFTEKNNWGGLRNFCMCEDFDDCMLYSLAKFYIQKQEFQKSLKIADILVEINPNDVLSEELIEKSKKGINLIKAKNDKANS